MNFKFIKIFIVVLLLKACNQYEISEKKKDNLRFEKKYKNIGFALIYNENLKDIKKLDDRSLKIYHKNLKRKSVVKITNPKNGKSLIAEVKSNKVNFSEFYNSIISSRIVEELELNKKEPYIELILVSKNSMFVAKKTKTFDEEKNVAEKVPVEGILIDDLNSSVKKIEKNEKEVFSYSIKIADFYYKDTAKLMLDRIKNETQVKNSKIIRLSKTKYRVLLGPFDDIKSIKDAFEKIKSLNFENVEILKNV